MNNLQIFNSPEFGQVRTIQQNGEPWFVGKDVAEILGYKDTSDAMKKHVDIEDKLTRRFADSGQNREMYIINESGLYSLIADGHVTVNKTVKVTPKAQIYFANKFLGGKCSEGFE